MELYKKHRPKDFDEVVGQSAAVSVLKDYLKTDTLPHTLLFSGPSGCVDCDTEYLTPTGWKRIDKYEKGDKVAQFNKETEHMSFVLPEAYIKKPCEEMYHIKTMYGVDQMLCAEHRVLYTTNKRLRTQEKPQSTYRRDGYLREKYKVSRMEEVYKRHMKCAHGWSGKLPTTFKYTGGKGLPLSEIELRLQVASIADGTYSPNRKKVCINIKRKRKIERMRTLLQQSNFEWHEKPQKTGYVRFYFEPVYRVKEFDVRFWECSLEQLKIINDEVLHWDGCVANKRSYFCSTSKASIDFIQFVFAVNGFRGNIRTDNRPHHKNTCYYVSKTSRNFCGIASGTKKGSITKSKSADGFKYCFTVPDGFLVLRRNGCVFVTGNCAKTTIGRILKEKLGCSDHDYNEINCADLRGIDDARDIIRKMGFAPVGGKCRIWLLDEFHQVSSAMANSMLKPLEDTPDHVYFILCTTDPQKILKTIKTRCTEIVLNSLSHKDLTKLVYNIAKKEGKDLSEDVSDQIASDANGSARMALVLLDKIINLPEEEMMEALVCSKSEQETVINLCRALMQYSGEAGFKKCLRIIKKLKDEPESIRHAVMGYTNKVMLSGKDIHKCYLILSAFKDNFYDSKTSGLLSACYDTMYIDE